MARSLVNKKHIEESGVFIWDIAEAQSLYDSSLAYYHNHLKLLLQLIGAGPSTSRKITTKMELITLAEEGLPKDAIDSLMNNLELSLKDFAELLPISLRTLQRQKKNEKLDKYTSVHLIEMAEIIARGIEVFNSKEKFIRWMKRPNIALGSILPMDLLSTSLRIQVLREELERIQYGLFV
jgi:putative toxin-antitoxin system antitoxin component (TIGR02293 family)